MARDYAVYDNIQSYRFGSKEWNKFCHTDQKKNIVYVTTSYTRLLVKDFVGDMKNKLISKTC